MSFRLVGTRLVATMLRRMSQYRIRATLVRPTAASGELNGSSREGSDALTAHELLIVLRRRRHICVSVGSFALVILCSAIALGQSPTPNEPFDERLSSSSAMPSESRNRALELVRRSDDEAIRRYKQGFFQRFSLSADWVDPSGDSGLELINLKTSATVAVPLGSFENLLLITPGFEVDLIEAVPTLDVPDSLYNADVDFMWRKQLNERWGTMLAIAPGYSSDFQSTEDAFRIRGRGFATWQWLPERLTLLFGVVYLDRNDLPLLPGAGLIWTPTPDWRIEFLFPRPKFAYRLEFVPSQHEHWVYLNGQLGGRTWAVERASGDSDELTLRDYRLSLGWERIVDGGGGLFAEIGWSFGRELEYDVVPLQQSLGDAVFLRGGIAF